MESTDLAPDAYQASDRQQHLELLVEKQKLESSLFYIHFNLHLVFLAVLASKVITVIRSGAGRLSPRLLSVLVTVPSVIATLVSSEMTYIIRSSSAWVNFWTAKTVLFELCNTPPNLSWYYFLDRRLKNPTGVVEELLKNYEGGNTPSQRPPYVVNPKKLEEFQEWLASIWPTQSGERAKQSRKRVAVRDPIARMIAAFIWAMAFWAIALLLSIVLAIWVHFPAVAANVR